MPQPNDLSRSRSALVQDSTIIAVVEMSLASWLVAAIVPGWICFSLVESGFATIRPAFRTEPD